MGIARFWEARVTVVCAYDSPRSFRRRGSIYLPEVRNEMEAEAQGIATEAVEAFVAAGIEATGVVFEGNVVDAILETAEDTAPDVIVIGGGSREGTRDYLVGRAWSGSFATPPSGAGHQVAGGSPEGAARHLTRVSGSGRPPRSRPAARRAWASRRWASRR